MRERAGVKARRTRSSRAQERPALTSSSEFLNIDLHVRSRRSLEPLLDAWPWAQAPDREPGRAPLWLVVSLRGSPKTAEQTVLQLVQLVGALPRSARRCWNEASSRVFDIGIQAGLTPISFEDVQLREESLRAIVRLRGRVLVTVYSQAHREVMHT